VRVVIFCHSVISDWNHGNAHFLRGVGRELAARGHAVTFYEPEDAWSLLNLVAAHGHAPTRRFRALFPELTVVRYGADALDLERVLADADLVLVHEWNDPAVVAAVGAHRAAGGRYRLLFHDTHHRAATAPDEMARFDLRHYDGVLAFGAVLRDLYRQRGWARQAWTWHEAADTTVFQPLPDVAREGHLVWVGNWGDDERTEELREFLLGPVQALGLRARVHGVRYPKEALRELMAAGIEYRGWVANYDVPRVFAQHALTVHVPRGPYTSALPGIPTIRPFEALACAVPLVCAPWTDTEGLFSAGRDYLVAHDAGEMTSQLAFLLRHPGVARRMAAHGRRTVLSRHTCAHRVDELLAICARLDAPGLRATASRGQVAAAVNG
jgi:spore maturation protein CgeB